MGREGEACKGQGENGMSNDFRTVVARLEQLEQQNRLMKIAGLVLLVLVGATMLMGQAGAKSKTIEAETLIIRDVEGIERAWLGVAGEFTSLFLYDPKGEKRLQISVSDNLAALSFFEEGEKIRTGLGILPSGSGLVLYDPRENVRGTLIVTDRSTNLAFHDENQKTRTWFGVRGGESWLELMDAEENIIWSTR